MAAGMEWSCEKESEFGLYSTTTRTTTTTTTGRGGDGKTHMAECSVSLFRGVCVGLRGVSVFVVTFIGRVEGAEHTKQRRKNDWRNTQRKYLLAYGQLNVFSF